VVDPSRQVRAPVTGTVVQAGSYALYCKYPDHYLVVEPDSRPGFEVKVLHFEGLQVSPGDRVEAGVTVIGAHARLLPFRSQVDDHTAAPHWPHVHVEVIDPTIPDRPGSGC
jgi:murein DD-endopeptidase MepM/ murein hydrolase activator NlpD